MNFRAFRTVLLLVSMATAVAFVLPAQAQETPDRRIGAVFARVFSDPSIYLENKCHDNVARLMLALRAAGIPLHSVYAMEIQNPGNYDFGMVAAQKTRTYPQNWFHHVALYDGTFVYDFDFLKAPTPTTPPRYFHQQFKTPSHQANRALCEKVLGTYKITFRPAGLYLQRYAREKLPAGYTLQPVEKRMRDLPGWGCDFNP